MTKNKESSPHNLIQIESLTTRFGTNTVLEEISVNFDEGLCTFIVGVSGVGKSVLAKHIAGLLTPSAGRILYRGTDLSTLSPAQLIAHTRRCTYVFQHPSLFDSVTAQENISLVLRVREGMRAKKADKRARELLDTIGLADKTETLVSSLSDGEKKQISIARAVGLRPETLILDEPTTGLDPFAATTVDNVISRLKKQRINLIVISHDLKSIRHLADRVIFLADRKIRFDGSSSEFFSSSDPIVREFLTDLADSDDLDQDL